MRHTEQIESLLVDAGELCPDDYQTGFDWEAYNRAIADVQHAANTALAELLVCVWICTKLGE